jgi:hypothetical protein
MGEPVAGHPFALGLTHDVDRPYKTYQCLPEAVRERDPTRLAPLVTDANPYWQFETVMGIERELGVRSSFYFLSTPHIREHRPRAWLSPARWLDHLSRYDVRAPDLREVVERLEAGGWEVGLHGSVAAADDPDRLRAERDRLAGVLDGELVGGRQHYLTHRDGATWKQYRDLGLRYDASLGSSARCGFDHGYGVRRPFDDGFVVFPLTLMEVTLAPLARRTRERVCDALLDEAAEAGAVATALWHPRYFDEASFPGFRDLYRYLVEGALDRGAWVGPLAELSGLLEP